MTAITAGRYSVPLIRSFCDSVMGCFRTNMPLYNLLREIKMFIPNFLPQLYDTQPNRRCLLQSYIPGDRIIFKIAAITGTVLVLFKDAVNCDDYVCLSVM